MDFNADDKIEFGVDSAISEVPRATEKIFDFCKKIQLSESDWFDIRLSFEEILINAIKHGNRFNKDLSVKVRVAYNDKEVYLAVTDQGEGIDESRLKDPTDSDNISAYSGRGVYLAKHLMDRFRCIADNGNCVEMVKVLNKSGK